VGLEIKLKNVIAIVINPQTNALETYKVRKISLVQCYPQGLEPMSPTKLQPFIHIEIRWDLLTMVTARGTISLKCPRFAYLARHYTRVFHAERAIVFDLMC
jgi:hypothetical protein